MSEGLNTARGWSSFGAGGHWIASEFAIGPDALAVRQPEVSADWHQVPLGRVIGLDHVGDDPDGAPILEFVLADGSLLHARFANDFLGLTVAALQASREMGSAAEPPAIEAAPAAEPAPRSVEFEDPPPPPPGRSGSKAALQREVRELREYVESLGLEDRKALRADIESLTEHRSEVLAEVRAATIERRSQENHLVRARRTAVLQDAGVYHPRQLLEDSAAYSERLDEIRVRIDDLVRADGAITTADDWTVNGSRSEGRKVVVELSKLLLRTYNADAEHLVVTMRPFELDAAIDRLTVTRDAIGRLGKSMQLEITDEFHKARLDQLSLTAEHLAFLDANRHAPDDPAAGHVFVVSNRGSLGEVVRIGVTAHADEAALLAEIDGPQLPFRSDVHTIVPVTDAAGAVATLRAALASDRVNLADPNCAFFRVPPERVRDLLVGAGVEVAWFRVEPEAEEWRLTENARHEPSDD